MKISEICTKQSSMSQESSEYVFFWAIYAKTYGAQTLQNDVKRKSILNMLAFLLQRKIYDIFSLVIICLSSNF